MINLQGLVIGGVLTAVVAFGVGTQVGKGWEASACNTRIEAVKKASAKVIDDQLAENRTVTAERDQARAEVDKINTAEAAKVAAAEAALLADQIRRDEALARAEAAASQAARETRALNAKLTSSLEAIRNVSDECARAPLSPDAKRVLDNILAP